MRAQQVGVDLGDPVRAVRSYDGKMCHAYLAYWVLLDEAHALHTVRIERVTGSHVVEEAPIDLVDDFEMPWDQHFEEIDRPSLECLRQQCMVGVRQCAHGQVPCVIPPELL